MEVLQLGGARKAAVAFGLVELPVAVCCVVGEARTLRTVGGRGHLENRCSHSGCFNVQSAMRQSPRRYARLRRNGVNNGVNNCGRVALYSYSS